LMAYSAISPAQTKENSTPKKWSYAYLDSIIQSHKGVAYVPFNVTSLDGKRFTNELCKGKVTFISLWFESCGGCRAEFPEINKLYDSIKQNPNYQFIAITYDAKETLPEFIKANKMNFPVATVSDYDLFGKLRYGMGCPGIIILDPNGRIGFIGMYAVTDNDNGGLTISIGKILDTMKELL